MDIKAIYERAWQVAKKYKILWFFGAIVAIFTSGGSSFNNFSNWESPGDQSSKEAVNFQETFSRLGEQLANLFSQVPPYVWVLLVVGLLVTIIVGILISWVARAWAVGSLIGGVEEALDDKELTVSGVAKKGFESFKSLLWLVVIPGLLLSLIFLAGVVGVGLVWLLTQAWWLAVILIFPLFVGFVIGLVVVSSSLVWAQRIAVIERKPGKESFLEGWEMTRKYFGEMVLLGLCNWLLSCCISCLVWLVILLVVFVAIFIIAFLVAISPVIGVMVGSVVALVGLSLLSVSIFVYGAYYTFNYSTWNILYRQLRGGKK